MIKKVKALLVSSIAVFTLMNGTNGVEITANSASTTKTIDILSINDFHGQLDPRGKNQGAANLVAEVNNFRSTNTDTSVVSAGDNFNGSAVSNLLYGSPVVDMMKEMGVTYSALGNHEYDWGLSKITDWKSQGIQFLSCNIINKSDGSVPDYVLPYAIEQIGDLSVAFVGLTTPQTEYTTLPANVKDIDFLDPATAAKKAVAEARLEGADVVIILAHIGSYKDQKGKITFETYIDGTSANGIIDSGADAIITGHSHQEVCGVIVNKKGKKIPVVQAYCNGRDLADLSISYNANTLAIISITPSIDKMYVAKHAAITPDATTQAMLDKSKKTIAPVLNEVLGANNVNLVRDDYTLSNIGEWTTDTMLTADSQNGTPADIATQNAHGLRVGLLKGTLTMADMYNLMPFDNVLTNVKMNGADVYSLFNYGLNDAIGNRHGQMQYSGCTVYYHKDPTNVIRDSTGTPVKDASGKTIPVRIIDTIILDNKKIVTNDTANTYTIATNDFMATGGDNYKAFKNGTMVNTVGNIRDILAENVKSVGALEFSQASRLVNRPVDNKENSPKEFLKLVTY